MAQFSKRMHKALIITWLYNRQGLNLAKIAGACLYILVGILCIQTLTLFIPSQLKHPMQAINKPASSMALRELATVTEWHLFGQDPRHLPSSQLQLALLGILAANPSTASHAVIATPDGVQAVYSVGDTFPGGAILQQILPDSVVIKYKGRMEILHLPKYPAILDTLPEGL